MTAQPRSELRRFWDEVYLPRLLVREASKSTIERHSAAIDRIELFCGRGLAPDEVDELLLRKFESHLWRNSESDARRRDLVESLRRICAAYDPSDFVDHRKRRRLPDPAPGTVREFYETIYSVRVLVGRTARYVDENRAVFWRLHNHFGRDVLLSELNDQLAAEHFQWLLHQGLRATTVNTGHRAVLFAVWRYAHELGLVATLPTIRKLHEIREEPDTWEVSEVERIIDCCGAAWDRPIAGIAADQWWEALLRVVWYTALRRRAVLAIRRVDVDLDTGWLRVPGSSMKNGRGKKLRLGLDAIEAIRRIWEPDRELLFPFPHNSKTLYAQFDRILKAAGVEKGKCALGCLHKIRRTVATEVARRDGMTAASTILGHRDVQTTAAYIDPSKMPGNDFTTVLPTLRRRQLETLTAAAG